MRRWGKLAFFESARLGQLSARFRACLGRSFFRPIGRPLHQVIRGPLGHPPKLFPGGHPEAKRVPLISYPRTRASASRGQARGISKAFAADISRRLLRLRAHSEVIAILAASLKPNDFVCANFRELARVKSGACGASRENGLGGTSENNFRYEATIPKRAGKTGRKSAAIRQKIMQRCLRQANPSEFRA